MVDRDRSQLPRHVAVIMDGNGRWAQQRGLPRLHGHRVGKESVRAVVETSRELGISYLSLYAFSTENWSRPPGSDAGAPPPRISDVFPLIFMERSKRLT